MTPINFLSIFPGGCQTEKRVINLLVFPLFIKNNFLPYFFAQSSRKELMMMAVNVVRYAFSLTLMSSPRPHFEGQWNSPERYVIIRIRALR